MTRRVRCSYVRTSDGQAGVRVSRVPPYPTPAATAPTDTATSGQDPTVSTGPAIPSDG